MTDVATRTISLSLTEDIADRLEKENRRRNGALDNTANALLRKAMDDHPLLAVVNGDLCLACGHGSLDTGWECNSCGHDHWPLVQLLPGFPWKDEPVPWWLR